MSSLNEINRKSVRSWAQVIVCFAALLIVGIWFLAIGQIAADRSEFRRNVTENLGNIAVTMSHNVARTSGELDTLLQFMRAMRRSRGPGVPWQDIVTDDYTLNRHTVQIAIIARDGMMVTSTKMLYPNKPVDLSDREHYRVHRDAQVDRLFISKPVLGRASGKWSVQYTRPLFTETAAFDGAIVVSLDPDKLTRIYGNLDLGPNGGILIVGDDGIIRAGTGRYSGLLGKTFDPGTGYASIGNGTGVVATGLEHRESGSTLVARKDVDGYPLRVIVMADDIGGLSWFLRIHAYLLGAVLLTGLTYWAASGAIRYRARESELLSRQNRFIVEKEVAEAASKTKGEFLAVMSHEIRTPLNGVLGALELMQTETLTANARRHLGIAATSGEYLLSLIDDILVFSKLEEGHFKLDKTPQSLRHLLASIETLFAPLMAKSGNSFSVSVGDEVPDRLIFDGVRLRQVLVNFLGNANKFTEQGTIVLSCDLVQANGERNDCARLRFAVSDTGVGIPEDKQKVIFEKFQSLDSSYSRRSDGTGLGLAICDQIVRAMGGSIVLESEYSKGSTFSFEIELDRAATETQVGGEELEATFADAGLRVLLAEDNPTNVYISSQYLLSAGHQVVHVENGREAVRKASESPFDVILMDISMPEKDGLEATSEIRRFAGPNRDTPIVALTAHAVGGTLERVRASGMNDYLTKPIGRERLLSTVRRHGGVGHRPAAQADAKPDAAVKPLLEAEGLAAFLDDRDLDGSSALLEIFVSEMEKRADALDEAVRTSDAAKASAIAHSIYGSASTVGAARLAALCRHLESEAKAAGDLDWQIADMTLTALRATVSEFRTLVGQSGPLGETVLNKVA